MADVMVTARMTEAKKAAGSRVLESIGSNASKIINELYDYLAEHKQSPFAASSEDGQGISSEEWREASVWMEALQMEVAPEFRDMTIKEARAHRLGLRGVEGGAGSGVSQ